MEAAGLSRSTYYYEISKTDAVKERNANLSSEITNIFNENKERYGVRRVHHELLNRGFKVNHKRVQRIMNQLSLKGKRPKEKYHSYKGDVGKVADNIINRDFSTEKPSYNLSTSPNMEQIKDMLNKAFERFPSVQGLVMHSDQGWQYQHAFYRNELQKHGIIQSMSRKGNCYDNCIMETFFGRLKNEMFYGFEKDYPSFEAFSKAIAEYIDYYNNSRIQAKTKWMPPSKFREASMMEG
ncbi:MAG: IS3 family transposase [Clostridiales bacterium]|nr:IS3 family transposase [Clostridiales bacterium]